MEDPYMEPQPAEQAAPSLFETVSPDDPDVQNLIQEEPPAGVWASNFDAAELAEPEEEAESAALSVAVAEPQMEGDGPTAYVSYRVSVKTSLPGFPDSQFQVRRRFNDFVWFHSQLKTNCPGYVVPPLPETPMFSKFMGRFDDKLMRYRARELEKFMRRVASSNVFCNSSDLKAFLNTDVVAFEEAKATKVATTAGKVGSALSSWFGSAKNAVVQSVPVLGGVVEERDEFFEQKTAYVEALHTSLQAASTAFLSLIEAHRSYRERMAQSVDAAQMLAKAESFDSESAALQKNWREAVDAFTGAHKAAGEGLHKLEVQFGEVLKDHTRYVEAVQDVLRYRWEKLEALVAAEKTLAARQNAKKWKQAEVEAAEKAKEAAAAEYERVSELVKEEVKGWQRRKNKEISRALNRLGNATVAFHLKGADSFKQLIKEADGDLMNAN